MAKTEVSGPFQEGEAALSVHIVVWMSAAELEFENGVERDNLPCCAGHASFHVVQDMVGFLGFKHTLTAFHPPILLSSPS